VLQQYAKIVRGKFRQLYLNNQQGYYNGYNTIAEHFKPVFFHALAFKGYTAPKPAFLRISKNECIKNKPYCTSGFYAF
jgi:hypothetical protein